MANSPQARKRARQNTKTREHRASQRSTIRTAIKKLQKLIAEKNTAAAKSAYQVATALIDRATRKGIHHANRAARLKHRLNEKLRGA